MPRCGQRRENEADSEEHQHRSGGCENESSSAPTVGVRGNSEAPAVVLYKPAVLHNLATRDISEHTGSRDDM